MARRRLSKRRLALFAGVLLCAAFGARRVAIRFSSPTSIASGDPAPSSGSAGAAHGLGAHARFGALQHGSRGLDGGVRVVQLLDRVYLLKVQAVLAWVLAR